MGSFSVTGHCAESLRSFLWRLSRTFHGFSAPTEFFITHEFTWFGSTLLVKLHFSLLTASIITISNNSHYCTPFQPHPFFFLCLRLSIFGSCLDPHPSDLSICIKYLVQCLAHSISLQVYGTIIITSLFRDLRVNSKYVPTKHSLFILPRVYTPNPYPIVYLISWAQKQRHKTEKSTEDGRYLKWSSWAG